MTPSSTSEEIRKIKAKPHVFCGGFDSDPVALNGHVKRLYIYSYPELKNGDSNKAFNENKLKTINKALNAIDASCNR